MHLIRSMKCILSDFNDQTQHSQHSPQNLGQYRIVGGLWGGLQMLRVEFIASHCAVEKSSQYWINGGRYVGIPGSEFDLNKRKKCSLCDIVIRWHTYDMCLILFMSMERGNYVERTR